jgi:hypothetical protein
MAKKCQTLLDPELSFFLLVKKEQNLEELNKLNDICLYV